LLAAAASFLLPGIPVIHNGDETGSLHELEVYEKNPVNWNANPEFRELYEQLIGMRKDKEVLRRGEFSYLQNSDEDVVTSFERRYDGNRAIVLLNWGESARTVTVHPEQSDKPWKEFFGEDLHQGNRPLEIRLNPYSFKVFLSEGQPQ
jgi:glycosidase